VTMTTGASGIQPSPSCRLHPNGKGLGALCCAVRRLAGFLDVVVRAKT
jgi:hypothetical protein